MSTPKQSFTKVFLPLRGRARLHALPAPSTAPPRAALSSGQTGRRRGWQTTGPWQERGFNRGRAREREPRDGHAELLGEGGQAVDRRLDLR